MATETPVLGRNRKAFHEYEVVDRLECGIALEGTEVKAVRAHNFNFTDAYARIRGGQLYLIGFHISPYKFGTHENHDPDRERKLLAHADEIQRLRKRVEEKGFTLIPLSIYLKNRKVKVELGVCRGKKLYDKRQTIKQKDQKREVDRELRRAR